MSDAASRAEQRVALAADQWQAPQWPAPASVVAVATTRLGGFSVGPYDSFNLGSHVGDASSSVRRNRALLRQKLGGLRRLQWLNQVHGTRAVMVAPDTIRLQRRTADAACSMSAGDGVVVLTADCLPVLFCSSNGRIVAAAHAGWRGLLDGVLENTVDVMLRGAGIAPAELLAWLGPAIGRCHFEVGAEVRTAFLQSCYADTSVAEATASAFTPVPGKTGKFLMDIYAVARARLLRLGLYQVYGGDQCTVCDETNFYSYRRDGVTGRMASLIYLKAD